MLGPREPKTQGEAIMQIHSAVMRLDKLVGEMCNTSQDHDERLTKLEVWKGTVTGRLIVASASSSVVGLVAGWILKGALGGTP